METLKFYIGVFGTLSASVALAASGTFNSAVDSGNWGDASTWTTSADHTIPNEAGDTVKFGPGTLTVDGDYTAGWLDLTNRVDLVTDGSPRVLTMDSGVEGTAAKITPYMYNWQSSDQCIIGDANLTLLFVSDALFTYSGSNSCNHKTTIAAKISGGSVEAPLTVTFDAKYDWGSGCWKLQNTANDFVGDINVVTKGGSHAAYLRMGSDDSTLGNAQNEITLTSASGKRNAMVCDSRDNTSKKFVRTVRGTGTIAGMDEWKNAKKLTLGEAAVVAPGTADEAGVIEISGSEVRMDEGTDFRLTLGADNSDKVVFTANSGSLAFVGDVVFDYFTSVEDIPTGMPIEIFQVSKVAFTFEPNSFPDDFTYSVSGSKESGWSVYAIRKSNNMTATTAAVSKVGDTFATLNAAVVIPEGGDDSSRLVFAYGTTDAGDSFGDWSEAATFAGEFGESGVYSVTVDDLTLGETYFYRVFTTVDGETYVAAPSSATFTTRALDVSDTFCWYEANGDWEDAANWYRLNEYARGVPGMAGDTLSCAVTEASSWTITLSEDQTFGFLDVHLSSGKYNNTIKFLAPENEVTLTLDPGTVAETSRIISTYSNPNAQFGADKDDLLTLKLATPLEIYCPNEGNDIGVHFAGPLTGGTAEAPCPITIDAYNNYWRSARAYFENEASDFVGDIYAGQGGACEGRCIVYIGNHKTDATLGDPANRVILRSTSCLCYLWTWGSGGPVCNRTVLGNGIVRCGPEVGEFGKDTAMTDDKHSYPLTLSATSRFEPCSADGTGYGTITFRAKSIACDPETVFAVDLAPEGEAGDKFVFKPNAGESMTLDGKLVVSPESIAAAKTGSTWTVVTVAPGAGEFVNNWKRPLGFEMKTEGSDEDGWTVTLTKYPTGTEFILR